MGGHREASTATVASTLADRAVEARERELPERAEHAAVRTLVDWFGATAAGSRLPPVPNLVRQFAAESAGRVRLVGLPETADVRTAALINGAAAHVIELDDIFSPGLYHPGAPTIAAALAVAETRQTSGRDLLRAITIGYEIGDRVAEAVNPAHYRYWHTTGTVGAIGAAAAVAELLGLDATRFAHAIATATTFAAGLQQAFRSDAMSKPLHSGRAAEAGVVAALAAGAGVTGALDILEGATGFGAAMAGGADWSGVLDAFGPEYRNERTSVKPYPCCGHTFAAIDAGMQLRSQGIVAADIERVEIASYQVALNTAGVADPITGFEAKFSLPFCAAAALVHGGVQLDTFEEATLADEEVRRLVRVTTLVEDPDLTAAFPEKRGARVTAYGPVAKTECVVPSRSGDPDNPVPDGDLDRKLRGLVGHVAGDEAAETLSQRLWRIGEAADVRLAIPAVAPDVPW